MSNQRESNIYLLPATIDHYQIQLTRMLETERYREAAETLEFLLGCRTEESNRQEWQALYEWLREALLDGTLADGAGGAGGESGERGEARLADSGEEEAGDTGEDEDVDESELLTQAIRSRAAADRSYVRSLLDTLRGEASPDKQLLAIEQLVHLDDSDITPALKDWLCRSPRHPLLQYRVLAALKRRGAEGEIVVPRLAAGRTALLTLEIGDTPLGPADHPAPMLAVLERVRGAGDGPYGAMMDEYAESVWTEYVQYVYGTNRYRHLAALVEAEQDAWAAALHGACESAFGQPGAVADAELCERYGVTAELADVYREALADLLAFMPAVP